MKNLRWFLPLLCSFILLESYGQELKSGFEKAELEEMIRMSAHFADTGVFADAPAPEFYNLIYGSEVVGLDNYWELWKHKERDLAVISIRGTTMKAASWLANLYAAMVPATGEIQLSQNDTFRYSLAENPQAAVHVGWLVSLGSMAPDIRSRIDSLYDAGTRDFILAGHSQGGAITYLLTAWLRRMQLTGELPDDIRFKTYNSAAPKPGNLYFAYDYEAMTQFGWAFNAVNSADWVPEVPMSIQTTSDFNKTNPFTRARENIKAQKFPANIALRKVYNSLDKPTRKAQRNYQKYLGELASKSVAKNIDGYIAPEYIESNNYARAGAFAILRADSAYYASFPDSDTAIFIHHSPPAYRMLVANLPDPKPKATVQEDEPIAVKPTDSLAGNWKLTYISLPIESFRTMYPGKRPTIQFEADKKDITGFAGCNTFQGRITRKENRLTFILPLALTRKYCDGLGELHFLETLKSVNNFTIADDGSLLLRSGKTTMMRLEKQ